MTEAFSGTKKLKRRRSTMPIIFTEGWIRTDGREAIIKKITEGNFPELKNI